MYYKIAFFFTSDTVLQVTRLHESSHLRDPCVKYMQELM